MPPPPNGDDPAVKVESKVDDKEASVYIGVGTLILIIILILLLT